MLDGRNRRIQPSSETWPIARPTEMMTAVMSAATSPTRLRAALAAASAMSDAFSARNRWIASTPLPPLGMRQAEELDQRPDDLADLGDDRGQVVGERDGCVDDRDRGRPDDHERDDGRDDVRDGDRDAATPERQMPLDERNRRLEDVRQQPGDEQDHGRPGEDREDVGVQGDDHAEERDGDQPEEQPCLATRHDATPGRSDFLGRHDQTVAYGDDLSIGGHRFMRRLANAVAITALIALSLAACGSSSSAGSATPDPTVAFCPALDAYGKSLAKLDALVATSSVDDYKNAVADAKAALAALKAVAGPFVGAQLDTLQTAQAQLEADAADLDANATPADAEAALQPDLENLMAQVVLTYNAICNAHPTPSSAS